MSPACAFADCRDEEEYEFYGFCRVLARGIVVAPGGYATFICSDDLSGASAVAISVTSSDDPDTTLNLDNVRLAVGSAGPGDWCVYSVMIMGSDFQYPDHGEAVVPVFGSTMKLVVFNDDTKPIKITRLSVQAINR